MEAHLSFNLDDPIDMKEHTHAAKGYRYFLIIEELIRVLGEDFAKTPTQDVFFIRKYAGVLSRLAGKHNMSELRAMIKNHVPEEKHDSPASY